MAWLSFFKKSKKRYAAIALDIGTEYVKSLIFEVKDGQGVIKGVGRQHQKLSDMHGGAVTDISGVIKNCEKALAAAAEKANFLPKATIIGIAGELVKGTTTTVRYTRPSAKAQISVAELKDIIAKIQRRAFERARNLLAWETGHRTIDVRLVNAAIVDVKIDGYRVTNPVGFQGKEVEVGIFNAFAPIVHLGALQTIADTLRLDLLSVAAEPYAVARAVAEEQSIEFSAICIDIGGGTTDIAVVRAGGVEGTKMFALGGRAFTKRLAQVFELPFTKAEELKISYSEGHLAKKRAAEVADALTADAQVWLEGVGLSLEEFGADDLLPSRILLCGGGSNLPEIHRVLSQAKWRPELPFAKKPTIQFIKPQDITRLTDETGDLGKPQDITPLGLANLGIDLVGEETVVEGIMGHIVESLRS